MKSIVLIIPYFGRLPEFFPIWKQSALENSTIDFLFFTDIDALQDEGNIRTVHISFSEFRALIQKKFDFPISLNDPYKLCDYKPAYGYALAEYIREYDFWGHCDIDLVFGDIRKFITDEILAQHQKILEHGHFTLYRNDEETNTVFMRCPGYGDYDYKKAFTSDDSLYFDEFLGTMLIFRKEKIPTYLNRACFFDILTGEKAFSHIDPCEGSVIFTYDHGRLYRHEKIGDSVQTTEVMYVHIQKRSILCSAVKFPGDLDAFCLIPNQLIPHSGMPEDVLFVCRGRHIWRYRQKIKHIRDYLHRYRNGDYPSFAAYRACRTQFRHDMENAKREIAGNGS